MRRPTRLGVSGVFVLGALIVAVLVLLFDALNRTTVATAFGGLFIGFSALVAAWLADGRAEREAERRAKEATSAALRDREWAALVVSRFMWGVEIRTTDIPEFRAAVDEYLRASARVPDSLWEESVAHSLKLLALAPPRPLIHGFHDFAKTRAAFLRDHPLAWRAEEERLRFHQVTTEEQSQLLAEQCDSEEGHHGPGLNPRRQDD